jgi:hypothetical protein
MSELHELRERAKELRCLYEVSAAVSDRDLPPSTVFLRILEIIPRGWQRPKSVGARIEYLGHGYVGPGFASEGHSLQVPIRVGSTEVGSIRVTDDAPDVAPESAFLEEERELLESIANRIGEYLDWKHTQLLSGRSPSTTSAHWRWRAAYAAALAATLDGARFGVSRFFLTGSVESGHAGPGSDVDVVIEFVGTDEQRRELTLWLEGWSLCLAELAFQQTGYRLRSGLLDVRWITPGADPRSLTDLQELALGSAAPQGGVRGA